MNRLSPPAQNRKVPSRRPEPAIGVLGGYNCMYAAALAKILNQLAQFGLLLEGQGAKLPFVSFARVQPEQLVSLI